MKTRTFYILFLLFPVGAYADEIPCRLSNYIVVTKSKLAINCTLPLKGASGSASLYTVVNGVPSTSPVTTGALSSEDVNFLVVKFDTDLQANTDYDVKLEGKTGSSNTPFDPKHFPFSTKPKATISLPVKKSTPQYRYGERLLVLANIALEKASEKTTKFSSEDAPGVFIPHAAAVEITGPLPDLSFVEYATADLKFSTGDTPKQLNSRFAITGLNDIFGTPVVLDKAQKRLAPASSPKSKDDSFYYAKLLHQAGINSKPAFILDGKLAPVFPIVPWRYVLLRPSATADIGQGGAIGKTKTNDLIQFGLGVGRFFRTEHLGPIQGIDPAAGFTYETNYEMVHKNALFTSEGQWFVAGTDESLKQKNFIRYVNEKKKDASLEPQDATKALFGYRFRFYTGVETGSQVSEETANASSGTSKVQIPKYSIARIYPKASLALDFTQRLTLTLSSTGRYLFATENVYRERDVPSTTGGDPAEQVYLTTVSGFRPSGEVGLAFALDDAGHYALSSAVKVGSLPPNFVRIATVQTGLTIKF
jgi:hypothetical protein